MLCVALLAGACAGTPAAAPEAGACTAEAAAAVDPCAALRRGDPVAYAVRIESDIDDRVLTLLERASRLKALADQPPSSPAGLLQRAQADRQRLLEVMHAEGYYEARIAETIDWAATPALVTLTVTSGTAYRLASVYVAVAGDGATAPAPVDLAGVDRRFGSTASVKTILAVERDVLRAFAEQERALARIADRRIVVDAAKDSVTVDLIVDPGPPVRFGPVEVRGLEGIGAEYVRSLVPWSPGEPYDQRKVDLLRERLRRTELFSSVQIEAPKAGAAFEELPVVVAVVERPPRTIGFGGSYSTTEGVGGELSWERRGLLQRNDTLRVIGKANRFTQSATVELERGDFRRPDQDLLLDGQVVHSDSKAYNELTGRTFAGIRRPLSPLWRISLGPSLETSRLKDSNGTGTSALAGLPVALTRDDTDDWLEPAKGTRLRLQATPYAGWFDRQVDFLVSDIAGSAYAPVDAKRRIVLAGYAHLGSIVGASRGDIPANKRFYAGGDGSVPGYRYQKVGPLDSDNQPLGGRSLFEVGGEVRANIWRNFGLGPFVAGGSVFDEVYPSFTETVRWAAGMGFWYVTAIGPVRFDVAFPINGRSKVDDPVEFYVGFGHAF